MVQVLAYPRPVFHNSISKERKLSRSKLIRVHICPLLSSCFVTLRRDTKTSQIQMVERFSRCRWEERTAIHGFGFSKIVLNSSFNACWSAARAASFSDFNFSTIDLAESRSEEADKWRKVV